MTRTWSSIRTFSNCTFVKSTGILILSFLCASDFSLNRTAFDLVGQPWQSGSSVIYSLGINLSIGEYRFFFFECTRRSLNFVWISGATFVHIGLWYVSWSLFWLSANRWFFEKGTAKKYVLCSILFFLLVLIYIASDLCSILRLVNTLFFFFPIFGVDWVV